MDLAQYLSIIVKRWLQVALITLAVTSVAAAVTLASTPQYTASTRLFFSVQGGNSISDLNQGSTYTESQLASFAQVASTPRVLDAVIQQLSLDLTAQQLAAKLEVIPHPNTVILDISVTVGNPEVAAQIANAVAGQLSETVEELAPTQSDGSAAVVASILTSASPPSQASSPNATVNLILGFLIGISLGVTSALLRAFTDTSVRESADIAALTQTPIIGSIVYAEGGSADPLFVQSEPLGARAEAIRHLRTNLQFVSASDRPNSIVVSSSVSGEGKSTVCINLALSLADAGSRVVLVDADLRRPSIANYMGLEGRAGLTTVLIGRARLEDVLQPWQGSSLDVLPSGQTPPNPSELLGSRAMSAVLESLCSEYEYVILDSPPLLPVTDAVVLSRMAGGTLVVAGADRVRRSQFTESLLSLEAVDAAVQGIVINKVVGVPKNRYQYDTYTPDEAATRSLRSSSAALRSSTWPGRPLAEAPKLDRHSR
jgi:capsular exopolysaccharide synthesis family protein